MSKQSQSSELLLLENHHRLSIHYLTGHDFIWYLSAIVRPFFYLATLNLVFYLLSGLPSLKQVYDTIFVPVVFVAELITYGWLGIKITLKAAWKTLPIYMKLATAAVAGGLTGVWLGLFMSLFKIFWFRQLWTIYNIITEPAIRLLEGLLVAGLAGLLGLLIVRYRRKYI